MTPSVAHNRIAPMPPAALLDVGLQRAQIGVAQAVVVPAGHDDLMISGRTSVLDAVTQHTIPVGRRVPGDHVARAGANVLPLDAHAAVVDESAAGTVGDMAVDAAARAKQVLAALQRGGVGGDGEVVCGDPCAAAP